MKSKLKMLLLGISIFHSALSFAQENIGTLKKRYFLADEKYAKKLILSNLSENGLQVEVINVLVDHNKAKAYVATDELSYVISMVILPKAGFSTYAFNDRFWQVVNYKQIKDSIITFDTMAKLAYHSFKSIREEKDQDSSLEKANGLSMKARTYNLIPIIKIDDNFYIPKDSEILTQCFAIDNFTTPKSSKEQCNGYLYTKAQANSNIDSVRTLADSLIDNAGLLVNKIPKNSGIYDKCLFLRKEMYSETYNFVHVQINRWFIGPYYREYSLKKYYGIGEFLFNPCIGIVGATYPSYLKSFYDWIPGLEKKQNTMFRAIQVNGIALNHYINLNCK